MKAKLLCVICKTYHTANSKHFPAVMRDKKDNSILGHICMKCVRKEVKREYRENRAKQNTLKINT